MLHCKVPKVLGAQLNLPSPAIAVPLPLASLCTLSRHPLFLHCTRMSLSSSCWPPRTAPGVHCRRQQQRQLHYCTAQRRRGRGHGVPAGAAPHRGRRRGSGAHDAGAVTHVFMHVIDVACQRCSCAADLCTGPAACERLPLLRLTSTAECRVRLRSGGGGLRLPEHDKHSMRVLMVTSQHPPCMHAACESASAGTAAASGGADRLRDRSALERAPPSSLT
jgi:hypothetical protein